MKAYLFFGVFLVIVLMITGCAPVSKCGDGICSSDSGETSDNCPGDCTPKKSEARMSIVPTSGSVSSGDVVILEVKAENINDLLGFQFDVGYNPDILAFEYVNEGTFLNDNGEARTICIDEKISSGLVRNIICAVLGDQSVSGDGLLAIIGFKAIASGKSDITLSNVKLAGSDEQEIKAAVSNTEITIQ